MPNSFTPSLRPWLRDQKPRKKGILVLSDMALSLRQAEDLIEVGGDLIDYAKYIDHFGTACRYSDEWLRKKNQLWQRHQIKTFQGGICFEMAAKNGEVPAFLETTRALGYSGVEIAEDVVSLPDPRERVDAIRRGVRLGLEVITEVGSKYPDKPLDVEDTSRVIQSDLDEGAAFVTVERWDIGLLKDKNPGALVELHRRFGERMIYEVKPNGWPEIAVWLIQNLGSDVNLGNVYPEDYMWLEGMRAGLVKHVGHPYFRK